MNDFWSVPAFRKKNDAPTSTFISSAVLFLLWRRHRPPFQLRPSLPSFHYQWPFAVTYCLSLPTTLFLSFSLQHLCVCVCVCVSLSLSLDYIFSSLFPALLHLPLDYADVTGPNERLSTSCAGGRRWWGVGRRDRAPPMLRRGKTAWAVEILSGLNILWNVGRNFWILCGGRERTDSRCCTAPLQ